MAQQAGGWYIWELCSGEPVCPALERLDCWISLCTRSNCITSPVFVQVDAGEFTDSEIIVMLGENGTGKTTFIRMLAGLQPDDVAVELPEFNFAYKPQKISPKFTSTVRNLLHKRIRDAYIHPTFITDVMKPMQVTSLALTRCFADACRLMRLLLRT